MDDFKVGGDMNAALLDYAKENFPDKYQHLTPERLERFSQSVVDGVNFIAERDGMLPDKIFFYKNTHYPMAYCQYDDGTNGIEINVDFLIDSCAVIDEKTPQVTYEELQPFTLTMEQLIGALSSEEAFHHVQNNHPEYKKLYQGIDAFHSSDGLSMDEYRNHPIEADAKLSAMREYLFCKHGLTVYDHLNQLQSQR